MTRKTKTAAGALSQSIVLDHMRLIRYACMTRAAQAGDVNAFSDGFPSLLHAILEYVALSLHCERTSPDVVALFPRLNTEEALKTAMGPDAYRAAITESLKPELVEAAKSHAAAQREGAE